MGLDVYVRFGTITVDEDGYKEYDFNQQYPNEYRDQMTGFMSAPWAGYLRESWGSLSWCSGASKRFGGPFPYGFFPGWSGCNGERLELTPDNLAAVLAFRDATVRTWLREHSYLEGDNWTKEDKEGYTAYKDRLADTWSFINFVELHRDKPNLCIVFG